MAKEIDILDVLDVCSDFLTSPEDTEAVNKFEELKQQLVIRSYLALQQKELVLETAILDMKDPKGNIQTLMSTIEISLTFNALLAYTNILNNVGDAIKDYDFYDLLWASGLCDYILEYCKADYTKLCDMIYRMLSAENLLVLIDELQGLDTKGIEELTAEFKRFRIETKPESLVALGNIAVGDDPLLKKIKTAVEETAFDLVGGAALG